MPEWALTFISESISGFPTSPVALLSYALNVLLLVLGTWQFYGRYKFSKMSDENKRLNTALTSVEATAAAQKEELDLRRASVEKLRADIDDQNKAHQAEMEAKAKRIGELETQTDLRPLIETITRMQVLQERQSDAQGKWIIEGRERFEAATQQLAKIAATQEAHFTTVLTEYKAQSDTFANTMHELSDGFRAHLLEDKTFQLKLAEHNSRIATVLDDVERRFNDVAVRLGMPKWSEKDQSFQPHKPDAVPSETEPARPSRPSRRHAQPR